MCFDIPQPHPSLSAHPMLTSLHLLSVIPLAALAVELGVAGGGQEEHTDFFCVSLNTSHR